ncbi:D-ribitol-5-phosphate cytidylyltransferase [Bagarius yarrelli]|uniref:D-ribitol-5-phosphate cytidylyltransferase n=1 Tax=Bagarius yarrelli TaxID=175774 RepID=A0A556U5Z7_BAGYA|nr:D-ribitol-5-phosphate cytidylyltransferase [Bagarius yarrelli]
MERDAVDFPVSVVLPAAGSGERTGLSTPKQFCTFLNRPLISFTIETFERIPWIERIVVVVAKDSYDPMLHIIQQFHHAKVKVVEGGTTRHRSIFSGLQAFSESSNGPVLPRPKVVIIHDAVRPFVDEEFLLKITLAAKEHGASGAIRPLVSTVIATTSEGFLDHSLERTKYRASEMPQGFLYEVIYQAYQRCSEFDFEFGTECLHLALQYSGINAKLIEGPPTLWKVTYKRDLAAAESIIKESLSLSACLISGAMAETVELSSRLQRNLESHHMTTGVNLFETEEMLKVFVETKHALLYPVVIVWVHVCMSDSAIDEELNAVMELSMKVKQENILLYGVQIIFSKVPELWERSVTRLTEITESLIRDRNPVLIGQMLRV